MTERGVRQHRDGFAFLWLLWKHQAPALSLSSNTSALPLWETADPAGADVGRRLMHERHYFRLMAAKCKNQGTWGERVARGERASEREGKDSGRRTTGKTASRGDVWAGMSLCQSAFLCSHVLPPFFHLAVVVLCLFGDTKRQELFYCKLSLFVVVLCLFRSIVPLCGNLIDFPTKVFAVFLDRLPTQTERFNQKTDTFPTAINIISTFLRIVSWTRGSTRVKTVHTPICTWGQTGKRAMAQLKGFGTVDAQKLETACSQTAHVSATSFYLLILPA